LVYFASLGALLPWWSKYLDSLHFDARQIGTLTAITMLTKVIAPVVWGWISDHTGQRSRVIRFGSFAAMLCFAGVFVADSFYWLAFVMTCYSFFWNATLPQFEATTFNHLGVNSHRYSRIRLWGSIGFIVSNLLLGRGLDYFGINILPWTVLSLFFAIWAFSLWVPAGNTAHHHSDHPNLFRVLKQPPVLALLVVCFLMQFSHAPYYTFYTLYLGDHGYNYTVIAVMWVVGVLAELVIFIVMQSFIEKIGLQRLLLLSLVLAALRWYLIGHFVDNWPILVFAQMFHAATFGIYHVSAIQLINRYFVGKNQGRGQALFSSVSYGLGGALGSFISGQFWDLSNGATITFNLSALAVVLAFVVAKRWIR